MRLGAGANNADRQPVRRSRPYWKSILAVRSIRQGGDAPAAPPPSSFCRLTRRSPFTGASSLSVRGQTHFSVRYGPGSQPVPGLRTGAAARASCTQPDCGRAAPGATQAT